nr:ADP/ATP-dependent (S)-NAD(P)H-hydrate dehydratase [uncultured Microbacterium sp.]
MVDVREWSRGDTARFLRVPAEADDKYSRGVVGLRTGSSAYPGAAVLGVEAAWRAGAGFVRYIGEGRAADAVLARRPETVVAARAEGARVGAWVIGSGTDPSSRTSEEDAELREILRGEVAVVVDAGALDLAASSSTDAAAGAGTDQAPPVSGDDGGDHAPAGRAPLLLTPHAREFARLQARLGMPADADVDPVWAVSRTAEMLEAVILLKGARTTIAAPDGTVIRVTAGTGWLATAGTGDVLGGVLGALLAANPDAPIAEVAAAGAWLHGFAGRLASGAGENGEPGHPIVALDVAEALPHAFAGILA